MSHSKPRKPVAETRYCARCLRAIPREVRAVVVWCDAPSSDPRPVAMCSKSCADAEGREQADYEAAHPWVYYG